MNTQSNIHDMESALEYHMHERVQNEDEQELFQRLEEQDIRRKQFEEQENENFSFRKIPYSRKF